MKNKKTTEMKLSEQEAREKLEGLRVLLQQAADNKNS